MEPFIRPQKCGTIQTFVACIHLIQESHGERVGGSTSPGTDAWFHAKFEELLQDVPGMNQGPSCGETVRDVLNLPSPNPKASTSCEETPTQEACGVHPKLSPEELEKAIANKPKEFFFKRNGRKRRFLLKLPGKQKIRITKLDVVKLGFLKI